MIHEIKYVSWVLLLDDSTPASCLRATAVHYWYVSALHRGNLTHDYKRRCFYVRSDPPRCYGYTLGGYIYTAQSAQRAPLVCQQ